MGIFGKSFDEKVRDAVAVLNKSDLGVRGLAAKIDGKVVTLEGQADSLDAKGRAMVEFNRLVTTENTINRIQIPEAQKVPPAPAAPTGPAPEEPTVYTVQPGDTLGALAQRFYGKASLYPKIFEANRDILNDPNLIKVGQKLKIPK